MAKAKFDITQFDLKTIQTEAAKSAQRVLNAGVGVTDLAVETVRDYVAGTQKRVADVQKTVVTFDPKTIPATGWATATDAYGDLVKRGQTLVGRIRRQKSTQDTVAAAETTVAKAKTTRTQAAKATKKTTTAAKKTAKKSTGPSRSSAKATRTSAKKTVSSASRALTDAAAKVGD
jgi:hypothetical protein